MSRFDGKVALVTGAVGGIGTAIVTRLLADGATVILCDRKEPEIAARVAELRAQGLPAIAAAADITDLDGFRAAVDVAVAQVGAIDILVANASTGSGAPSLAKTTAESWRADTSGNLAGQYHCVDVVLEGMKRRRAGAIVMIGSVNGLASFGNPAYSAVKAALISFTRTMATEYGPFGIRANIICPGTVRTPSWARRVERNPDIFENLRKWYPLGRVAEPSDIANAVAFLASDDAGFISGAVLPVDGGLMAGNRIMVSDLTLEPL